MESGEQDPVAQDDPMLRLRYYRETGQTDEAAKYERYLRETGQFKEPQGHDFHAEYASGALGKRMAGANARDAANVADEEAAQPGYGERLATHVLNAAQGIPGMERLQAYIGAKARGVPYEESLKTLREATDNIGGKTKTLENVLGGAGLGALRVGGLLPSVTKTVAAAGRSVLPATPWIAGAALGGADQALGADQEGLVERAGKTVAGAIGGAAVGKLSEAAGNALQRSGITDKAAQLLRNRGPQSMQDVGQAMGASGAANKLLDTRGRVLDQLAGSEKSASSAMLDHVRDMKSQANDLYDIARQDTRVVNDPRVMRHLQDPDMQQLLGVVRSSLGSNTSLTMVHPGAAAVDPMYADIPTPEELAMMKRQLAKIASGRFQGSPISQAQAIRLSSTVDDLRSSLHAASQPWAKADQFYAQAKNFENAYQKSFGVQQRVTERGLDPSKLKTPEAVSAWVGNASGTPIGLARASGQQAGAAGKLAENVRSAPLAESTSAWLEGTHLDPTNPRSASIRAPAFGGNGHAADSFTEMLGDIGASGAKEAASFGQSASPWKPWTLVTKPWIAAENSLASPVGVRLRTQIAGRLGDPSQAGVLAEQVASAGRGREKLDLLRRLGLSTANSPFASP